MLLKKERLLSMYKDEIKKMKSDLKIVKSTFSKKVIQEEIDAMSKQYEFSKTMD